MTTHKASIHYTVYHGSEGQILKSKSLLHRFLNIKGYKITMRGITSLMDGRHTGSFRHANTTWTFYSIFRPQDARPPIHKHVHTDEIDPFNPIPTYTIIHQLTPTHTLELTMSTKNILLSTKSI